MALGSSSEEVFRFSIVRNPQTVPSDKLADTVVKIVPDDAGEQYKYLAALISIHDKKPARHAFIAQAERMMAAPEFLDSLKNLKTPLWRYVEGLQKLAKVTLADATELISSVFGMDAARLCRTPASRRIAS